MQDIAMTEDLSYDSCLQSVSLRVYLVLRATTFL